MRLLQLSFTSVVLRFYLMMGIVIGAFFIGQGWLSILALPVLLSTLLGIQVRFRFAPKRASKRSAQTVGQHQPAN